MGKIQHRSGREEHANGTETVVWEWQLGVDSPTGSENLNNAGMAALLAPSLIASAVLAILEAFHAWAHTKVLLSIPPVFSATLLYGKVACFYWDATTVMVSGLVSALRPAFGPWRQDGAADCGSCRCALSHL